MANVSEVSDMEIDIPSSDVSSPKFSINVLELVRKAQMHHGLRQNDYTRYRRYCTARLRRLYKSLKFTHGRGKYNQRDINESSIKEVRHLHIVLYLAERAWSYAMEKKSISQNLSGRQHIHFVSKKKKAIKWATLFAYLCGVKGDSKTSLEAEAYTSYLKGTLFLVDDKKWDTALLNLKQARSIYKELGKVVDVENQILCQERVDELDLSINICLNKLGKSSVQTSEFLDAEKMDSPALDLIKGKLEAVMSEARSQQAVSMTEFRWLGHSFSIKNVKTGVFILKARELEKILYESAVGSVPDDKKHAVYGKLFSAYQEAKSTVHNDLVTAGNTENVKDNLNGLHKALSSILIERTVDYNQFRVKIAKNKLSKRKDEKGEKVTKPDDLVRLYDLLIQKTTDLCDLISSGRDRKPEESESFEGYTLKGLYFCAERCFWLAKSYSLAGKRPEAYVLYSHAQSLADNALKQILDTNNPDKGLIEDLKLLMVQCRSNACLEHAAGIMDEENVEKKLSEDVSNLSLSAVQKKDKFLLDNLECYESAVGDPNTRSIPKIQAFPPPFQAIPCNPIVLDIAYDSVKFPSLDHRVKKDKKGLLSRLWRS